MAKNSSIKLMKIIFSLIVVFIGGISAKNVYLTHLFNSLNLPISVEIARKTMGEPNAIDEHPTAQEQLWVYNKTFLPAYYILVVKNNVVVEKFHLD